MAATMNRPKMEWRRITDLLGGAPAIPDPCEKSDCNGCGKSAPWSDGWVLLDHAQNTATFYCSACARKRTRDLTRAA